LSGRSRDAASGARSPREATGASPPPQPNNPLHGVTLEMMLTQMVERFGWEGLARDVPIRCFLVEPSMTSALKYLRKAPRARKKVEEAYARSVAERPTRSRSVPATGVSRPSRRRT
jgi:uncharacterized protein (DUF2132 family)